MLLSPYLELKASIINLKYLRGWLLLTIFAGAVGLETIAATVATGETLVDVPWGLDKALPRPLGLEQKPNVLGGVCNRGDINFKPNEARETFETGNDVASLGESVDKSELSQVRVGLQGAGL